MQKNFTIIILLSTTLFLACHKKEMAKNTVAAESKQENKNSTPVIKEAIIDSEVDLVNTGAAYNIDSIKIDDDVLSIFVNYSGGCKEHSFELYSNGMYAKSLPPQLPLSLKHTNNDDSCRELVTQELKFNINKLKYPGKNTVILKVGEKQRVSYITKPI